MPLCRRFCLPVSIAVSLAALSGCATITAVQVDADGKQVTDAAEGIRYYLPRPYLLVTELPVSPQSSTSPTGAATKSGDDSSKGSSPQNSTSSSQPQTAAPASSTADTSFSATMASYSVKLIYLPDYKHAMALKISAGAFGSISSSPTLQDGWMLTGASSSIDSGTSAALTAVAGLATGGGSSSKGSSAKGAVAPTNTDDAPKSINSNNPALKDFGTVKLISYGQQVGEGTAPAPSDAELKPLTKAQLETFVAAVTSGANARATSTNSQITWGPSVLPPGLYAFEFDYETTGNSRPSGQVSGASSYLGLIPLMYFCKEGIVMPTPGSAADQKKLTYQSSCNDTH